METVHHTVDRLLIWFGWKNVQADDVPNTPDNQADYLEQSEQSPQNIVGIVLDNDDETTRFVFHTFTEDTRFWKYVAIHPERLHAAEFIYQL